MDDLSVMSPISCESPEVEGTQRASKRAKTTANDTTDSPGKTLQDQQRKSLSLLPTSPLNIPFQIFSLLQPRDLVSLSRTSKELRSLVLSKKFTNVWKQSLELRKCPACPEDMSEPHWAALLFSDSSCENCGARGVERVDFGLRRRICKRCMKANLVAASKFSSKYPNSAVVMDIVPYTIIGRWSNDWNPSNSKYFWDGDIQSMQVQLNELQGNVDAGVPGAAEAMADFVEYRKGIVQTIRASVQEYDRWFRRASYQSVKDRLKDMGYLDVDIDALKSVDVHARLGPAAWAKIQARVETLVNSTKRERILSDRRNLVVAIYQRYKVTIAPPVKTLSVPPVDFLYTSPQFKNLIEADLDQPVLTRADFEPLWPTVPSIIDDIVASLQTMLKKATQVSVSYEVNAFQPNTFEVTAAALVFRCMNSKCGLDETRARLSYISPEILPLIGYEGVIAHSCYRDKTRRTVELWDSLSKAAVTIITALGRDPGTATPESLDQLDARIVCLTCPGNKGSEDNSVIGRAAFTWRAAIHHIKEHSAHGNPSWAVLNADERAAILKREHVAFNQAIWACNHCSAHVNIWVTHSRILEHLGSHRNASRVKGTDYFRNPAAPLSPKSGVTCNPPWQPPAKRSDSTAPVSKFFCKHCSKSHRTFVRAGIMNHLKDKHKITKPVSGTDYTLQA